MIKFIIGIAVVVFSTYIGRLFSRRYKRRKDFFQAFDSFNHRFLSELGYSKRPIGELCASIQTKGEFFELVNTVISNRVARRSSPIDLGEYQFLSQEEKGFTSEYFSVFGKCDTASQKGYFTQAGNSISSLKTKAEDEYKKYSDLYTKLGFLCGLAIMVILI
jgi:stage III sporulation protein AB